MLADIYLRPASLYGFIHPCTTPPLNYAHKPKDVSLCQTIAALPEHSASHKSLGAQGGSGKAHTITAIKATS